MAEYNNNKFSYSYAAPTERERQEVESLRKEYLAEKKETDKMTRLRMLDGKVKNPPQIMALTLGIVGTLIFGGGMAMILEAGQPIWGTLVSLIGIVPLAFAYPVYKKILKKQKEKYRAEILQLSEEILNENKEQA